MSTSIGLFNVIKGGLGAVGEELQEEKEEIN